MKPKKEPSSVTTFHFSKGYSLLHLFSMKNWALTLFLLFQTKRLLTIIDHPKQKTASTEDIPLKSFVPDVKYHCQEILIFLLQM